MPGAGLGGECHHGYRVAVGIRYVQSFLIGGERYSLWTRSRQRILGEAYVNSLDFLIRRSINHRNAVRIRIGDEKPSSIGTYDHRRGMPVNTDVVLDR